MEKQAAYKLYVRSIGKKIAESKIESISGEQNDTKNDPDIISAFSECTLNVGNNSTHGPMPDSTVRYSRKEGREVSADNLMDHVRHFFLISS